MTQSNDATYCHINTVSLTTSMIISTVLWHSFKCKFAVLRTTTECALDEIGLTSMTNGFKTVQNANIDLWKRTKLQLQNNCQNQTTCVQCAVQKDNWNNWRFSAQWVSSWINKRLQTGLFMFQNTESLGALKWKTNGHPLSWPLRMTWKDHKWFASQLKTLLGTFQKTDHECLNERSFRFTWIFSSHLLWFIGTNLSQTLMDSWQFKFAVGADPKDCKWWLQITCGWVWIVVDASWKTESLIPDYSASPKSCLRSFLQFTRMNFRKTCCFCWRPANQMVIVNNNTEKRIDARFEGTENSATTQGKGLKIEWTWKFDRTLLKSNVSVQLVTNIFPNVSAQSIDNNLSTNRKIVVENEAGNLWWFRGGTQCENIIHCSRGEIS